jgi:S1-C subfamily serine protease
VKAELSQVLPDGALAYVTSSSPRIGAESSSPRALIYIKNLPRGLADGDGWEGRLYLIGTHRYLTRGDYLKTVKMFTADKTTAARLLIAKRDNAGTGDSDSGSTHGKSGRKDEPDEEVGTSMGTGWLTSHGYVVTCFHVVKGHAKVFIKSRKIEKLAAKIVQKDPVNDIAVLKPERLSGLPPGLPIAGSDLVLAQKVFTLGYPQVQLLGDALKYTEGTVSALSGLHDDARCIQISVPVQSGNSGGPLLNTSGEVVGIIVSKLAAINVFKWTGDLPENVNYAVRTDYAKPLFGALDKLEFPVLSPKKEDVEELVSRLSPAVVMVIAE